MARAGNGSGGERVSEMMIVDTFTRLIFGEDASFSELESSIIQALRLVDGNVTMDSPTEMGGYLRSLGVAEMIKLVARVQTRLSEGMPLMTNPASSLPGARPRYL